ncbi:unnamed protein product [Miscanthus lutarioriparius]|uniref:Uncharacterized protein n=1 Tax=Miscanthus lutarioriparius TaxID=422564 RepID=A0A811NJ66_9POAL|nr:unnamed protein product [Miscanthus lutarioriparius]
MGAEAAATAALSRERSGNATARSSESVMQAAVAAVTSAEAESDAVRASLFSSTAAGGHLERSILCSSDAGDWLDGARAKRKGKKQANEHLGLGHISSRQRRCWAEAQCVKGCSVWEKLCTIRFY